MQLVQLVIKFRRKFPQGTAISSIRTREGEFSLEAMLIGSYGRSSQNYENEVRYCACRSSRMMYTCITWHAHLSICSYRCARYIDSLTSLKFSLKDE